MARLTIRVEGMHCDGCATRLGKVLKRLDGVKEAGASFADGQCGVECAGDCDEAVVRAAIAEAGFQAKETVS